MVLFRCFIAVTLVTAPLFVGASPIQPRAPQSEEPKGAAIEICTDPNRGGSCKSEFIEFTQDDGLFTECINLQTYDYAAYYHDTSSFYVQPGAYCRTFSASDCVYQNQTAFIFPPGEIDLDANGVAETVSSFRCQICTACTG